MQIKGLKQKHLEFILDALKWGKYDYEQTRSLKYLYDSKGEIDINYRDNIRRPKLVEFDNIMSIISGATKKKKKR